MGFFLGGDFVGRAKDVWWKPPRNATTADLRVFRHLWTDGRTDRQTPRYGIDRAAKINKRRYKVRNEDRYKYRRSIVVSIMMA